jgi:hypothetical protein
MLSVKRARPPKHGGGSPVLLDHPGDLVFTSAYIGVMSTTHRPASSVYEALRKHPPLDVQTWYFDHLEGALWIGVAGEHAEPLTDWLDNAHEQFTCTTMLVAALANGIRMPPVHAYSFTIPRRRVTDDVRRMLATGFAMYLPHSDEFQVIADPRLALSIRAGLDSLPQPIVGLTRRPLVATKTGYISQPGRYDPVEALFREVKGAVARSARDAARDLVKDWSELFGEPVPADLVDLRNTIEEEKNYLADLHREARRRGRATTVFSAVDRHVKVLRKMRRTAFDLSARIRDYEWPPRSRSTYDRLATPLTLRAIQRYAMDIARRLGITGYAFVPIVGRDFTTTTHSFSSLPESHEGHSGDRTVVIEMPAEVRMRLGAVPMIAHEVVGVMTERLDEIARCLVGLKNAAYPELYALLPKLLLRRGHAPEEDVRRHQLALRNIGRKFGADLLACAAAGPPFIFALARFGAGTGSAGTQVSGTEDMLPLQTRLSMCIGLLNALGRPPGFISSYLPDAGMTIPPDVIAVVRTSMVEACASEDEIRRITTDLRAGRVVRALPTAILEALWRSVASRSGYLHEIAALVSVANND